ncbi:hypothetical protein D9M71_796410 [compost metagenome]
MAGRRFRIDRSAIGNTCSVARCPALPNEAPCPGACWSMTTTRCPWRANCRAQATPMMPAPTTAMSAWGCGLFETWAFSMFLGFSLAVQQAAQL